MAQCLQDLRAGASAALASLAYHGLVETIELQDSIYMRQATLVNVEATVSAGIAIGNQLSRLALGLDHKFNISQIIQNVTVMMATVNASEAVYAKFQDYLYDHDGCLP